MLTSPLQVFTHTNVFSQSATIQNDQGLWFTSLLQNILASKALRIQFLVAKSQRTAQTAQPLK